MTQSTAPISAGSNAENCVQEFHGTEGISPVLVSVAIGLLFAAPTVFAPFSDCSAKESAAKTLLYNAGLIEHRRTLTFRSTTDTRQVVAVIVTSGEQGAKEIVRPLEDVIVKLFAGVAGPFLVEYGLCERRLSLMGEKARADTPALAHWLSLPVDRGLPPWEFQNPEGASAGPAGYGGVPWGMHAGVLSSCKRRPPIKASGYIKTIRNENRDVSADAKLAGGMPGETTPPTPAVSQAPLPSDTGGKGGLSAFGAKVTHTPEAVESKRRKRGRPSKNMKYEVAQDQMAAFMGVTKDTVSKWERGVVPAPTGYSVDLRKSELKAWRFAESHAATKAARQEAKQKMKARRGYDENS